MDLIARPIEEASTPPAAWYTDAAFHTLDRDLIHRRAWQYVGPAAPVAERNSWHVTEAAGVPALVVRDQSGTLRALHNVCRHRAGPLATADGRGRVLTCRYHGWSYGLDGRLAGTPHCDGMKGFDRAACRLPEMRVIEWNGMLLLNVDGAAATPDSLFNSLNERVAPFHDLGGKRFHRRDVFDIDCNWKTYVDNYLEGYHVGMVHPGLAKVLDTSAYKTEYTPDWSLQFSPIRNEKNPYGDGGGWAFYYFVFPNLMLNILPGRVQVNVVQPRGPEACRVVFDYYYDESVIARHPERIQSDREFSDQVQHEDIGICLAVQRGLASGSYVRGRYSPVEETALHHFHEQLRSAFRSKS